MSRTRGSGCIYCRNKECTGKPLPCGHPLYVKYSVPGKKWPTHESSRTTSLKEATAFLEKRLAEARTGQHVTAKSAHVTLYDLYQDIRRDYIINGQKTIKDLASRWTLHLEPFFGAKSKAISITKDKLKKYVEHRKQQGAENATVNRELAALKRMFTLAQGDKVQNIPKFPHLKEDNIRKGFVSDAEYSSLAEACLNESLGLRGMFETGYRIGWRVSELKDLRVSQVDLPNRWIRLEPGTTKNKEGRNAPMDSTLHYWLEKCCHDKDPDRYVFSRDEEGVRPIRNFRESWERVTAFAGAPERIFHDLRRTAVRNMVQSGIPERVAMEISGHKTRSVFDRYHIVSESDLLLAAQKMDQRCAAMLPPSKPEELVHVPQLGTQSNEAQMD